MTKLNGFLNIHFKHLENLHSSNFFAVDLRVSSVQICVAENLRKESGKDDIEVVSSDGDDDDVDVGNAEVEAEVHEITTCEALTFLDKLVNLKELNKDERVRLYVLIMSRTRLAKWLSVQLRT